MGKRKHKRLKVKKAQIRAQTLAKEYSERRLETAVAYSNGAAEAIEELIPILRAAAQRHRDSAALQYHLLEDHHQ